MSLHFYRVAAILLPVTSSGSLIIDFHRDYFIYSLFNLPIHRAISNCIPYYDDKVETRCRGITRSYRSERLLDNSATT